MVTSAAGAASATGVTGVDPRAVPPATGKGGRDHISVHFSVDPESPINLYFTEDLT